jgi:tetratricopeptide (TPR) repeat protein
MNKEQQKSHPLLIYLLLGLATLIVFEQVRRCDFVNYDDPAYVTDNYRVRSGISIENVVWAFTSPHLGFWHPLTMLSHALDCQLFGLNPKWHHIVNLLFHTANALLLFWVLKGMTGVVWQSAFVAAAFALHPLHVESVAWVSERKDVLSTLFWFLTMAAYLRYVRQQKAFWYLVTLLLFALGLMAKPMLVTLPFVLLLLDYWPLDRLQTQDLGLKTQATKLIFEKLPFFALTAVFSIIAFLAQKTEKALSMNVPLDIRFANIFISYLKYIEKMVWPANLTIFYPYPDNMPPIWKVAAAVFLLLGISGAVVYLGRKRKYLIVGWLWYLGTLVPVIGFVPLGCFAMADRFTYLPLTGLFIMIAWAAEELVAPIYRGHRKIVLGLPALAVLLALSVCSVLQLRYWRSNAALFEHALKVTDRNYVAHNNLGVALQAQGRLDEAIDHYRQAIEINPAFEEAYCNMGVVLHLQGKLDKAVEYYHKALSIDPSDAKAHYTLGLALKKKHNYTEAITGFRQALKLKPDFVEAYDDLADLLVALGKPDEAVPCYQHSLSLQPDYSPTYYKLGCVFASQGKFNEAADCFQQALRIKPDYAQAQSNLGVVLKSIGRLDEAIRHYLQALKIKPDSPQIHNNLGNALLAQGRTNDAVDHFHQALKLDPNHTAASQALQKLLKNAE